MASWDRQENEPRKAWEHFGTYRDLGSGRTLEKVGKIHGVSSSACEQESAAWNWVARSDQWDAHLRATHDRAMLTEAARRGRQRAKAYSDLLDTAAAALKQVNLEQANLSQVASAMKTACEGMRLEEGLATAHVTMEMQDARAILGRLPAGVREGLRGVLVRTEPDSGPDSMDLRALAGDAGGDE